MNAQELRDRTKKFSIEIIRFVRSIPPDTVNTILIRQLVRSATSMASNYRATGRSRSKAEFYSKLSIVVEEADETLFWIEILLESKLAGEEMISELRREALELLKIFSSARKSFKEGIHRN